MTEDNSATTCLEISIHGQTLKYFLDLKALSQRLMFDECQGGLLYEFPSVLALDRFLGPGDSFIDAGAHIGFFALIAAVMVGPNGRVLAFEPDPSNFRALQRNVEVNGLQNVDLVNAALGETEGLVTLYENLDNDGGHALWPPGRHPFNQKSRQNNPSTQVPQVTIDQAIRRVGGLNRIAALKIDTEGSEVRVARGARACLSRSDLRLVICEHNRFALTAMGATTSDLIREFYGFGFKGFITDDGANFREIGIDDSFRPRGPCVEKFDTERAENVFFLRSGAEA